MGKKNAGNMSGSGVGFPPGPRVPSGGRGRSGDASPRINSRAGTAPGIVRMCRKCLKTIAVDAKPDPGTDPDMNLDTYLDADADADADAGIDNSDKERVEGNVNRGKERKPAYEWDSYADGQRYWCGGYAFTAGRI